MGKFLIALSVFLASYLPLNASSPSEPLHYQLASDPHLNGKGKDGECMDYALALSSRLAQHGIHGRLIFYRTASGSSITKSRTHARFPRTRV